MLYERVMDVACIKHSECSATVEKHYNNERLIQSHLRESSANQKTLFTFNPVIVTFKVLCQVFATFLSYLLKKLLSGIVHLLPCLSFGFWSVLISVNSSKTNKEKKTQNIPLKVIRYTDWTENFERASQSQEPGSLNSKKQSKKKCRSDKTVTQRPNAPVK